MSAFALNEKQQSDLQTASLSRISAAYMGQELMETALFRVVESNELAEN